MTRARRAAVWMVAAAIAAAPALATGAQACLSCCCSPAPAYGSAGECEATVGPMPCGGATAAQVPTTAKRAPEQPFQAAIAAAPRPVADLFGVRRHARACDPDALVSPLRLSVVLRL